MEHSAFHTGSEELLYAYLLAESQRSSSGQKLADIKFLYCQFFQINIKPSEQDLEIINPYLDDLPDCTVYYFDDGDIVIKWAGQNEAVRSSIIKAITSSYAEAIKRYFNPKEFFVDYDLMDGNEKLRLICAKKLNKPTKHGKELAKFFTDSNLISTLRKTLQLTKMQRTFRGNPHILIVEDQVFSQRLMTSILKDYTCYIAKSSGDALMLYMEKNPDIVFLDIDLPDVSGHSFAKLISKIDDDAYVVMVSANHYAADVKLAQQNMARNFIGKPYEKEAILRTIDNYKKEKKTK